MLHLASREEAAGEIAHIARMGDAMHVGEFINKAAIFVDDPIGQDHGDVMIQIEGGVVFDDQRTHQAARHLLLRDIVRMIPIGPRIGRHEAVGLAVTGVDQVLRQHRDTVHPVFQPDAVPVNGGALFKPVLDLNRCPRTPFKPDLWSRHRAVEPQHCGGAFAFGKDLLAYRFGLQLQWRLASKARKGQNRSGGNAGEELSSVHVMPYRNELRLMLPRGTARADVQGM